MKRLKNCIAILLCAGALLVLAGCEQAVDVASPIGNWFGNTYVNYRFLLQADVPEEWTVSDEESRLALIGATYDMVNANDLETLLNRAGTFYDLVASSPDDNQHLTVTVEKAQILNRMVYTAKSLLEDSVALYVSNLENAGVTNVQHEVVEKELAGSKRTVLKVSGNNNGTMMYMEMFYIKSAKYYCCVNMASQGTDEIANMESMFSAARLPDGSLMNNSILPEQYTTVGNG